MHLHWLRLLHTATVNKTQVHAQPTLFLPVQPPRQLEGAVPSEPAALAALQDAIPTSLLKLGADNSARAVKMFGGVHKYMGVGAEGPGAEQLPDAMRVEVAAKLMHQAIKRPELRDELYMQVSVRLPPCRVLAQTCTKLMRQKATSAAQLTG